MTQSPTPFELNADTMTGGMNPILRVVFSIGSNLGDRLATLQGAVAALEDTPELKIQSVSSVYETVPIGAPADSPDFLNAIVLADSALPPETLLSRVHALEDAFGRTRADQVVNAPRTLDVDLIVAGGLVIKNADLVLPHPHAHDRAFVLIPWLEVDPDAEIPGRGRVADLIQGVDRTGVTKRPDMSLIL